MSGSPKPCLFCGATGVKLTKEHVYPRWLHRALNIQGEITYSSEGKPVRVVSELDVQIREVCESCNSGWLHDLERDFRAAMIWPMNGLLGVAMPRELQLVVSTWAVKTWFLLEKAMAYVRGDEGLDPPPPYFRWLRERSEPPPYVQVWIGAVDAVPERLISFTATRWVRTPPDPPVGISGIFTIGDLLFQVYTPVRWEDGGEGRSQLGVGGGLASYLIPIWPRRFDEVVWPPPAIFTAADLRRIWPSGGHIEPGPPP